MLLSLQAGSQVKELKDFLKVALQQIKQQQQAAAAQQQRQQQNGPVR